MKAGDFITQPPADHWAYEQGGRHFLGFRLEGDVRRFSIEWSDGSQGDAYGDREGCPTVIERPEA